MVEADDQGIWLTNDLGARFGVTWTGIRSISGYKWETLGRSGITLELDHDCGEFLSVHDMDSGFLNVVEAITKRISGIPSDWFPRIDRLNLDDETLVVWSREPRL